MKGILLNSQVQQYYDLRNLFLVLSAFFIASAMIYGIRIHIIRVIQKRFGIEKRREIARMRKGTRNTSGRLRPVRYAGKSQQAVPETVVLDTEETIVLSQQPETAVLQPEDNTGFRKRKNIVIVHGKDIF